MGRTTSSSITTDAYQYNWQGLRTRANLNGTYYRYIYNGERVLEELNDSGGVLARYTTENDSYYGTLLHLQRYTGESRFPIYDEIGSARGLIDAAGTVTDTYDMDTFGKPIQTTGSTPNPYRFGGAWGYITDPNGFLQLGARYLWPEVGRFVSQDPVRDGENIYIYTRNRPTIAIDPDGLKPKATQSCPKPRKSGLKHAQKCKKQLEENLEKCREKFGEPSWGNAAEQATKVGLATAAGGAVTCAITGPSAAVGGVAGGLGGAVGSGVESLWDYIGHRRCVGGANKKYEQCMSDWRPPRR